MGKSYRVAIDIQNLWYSCRYAFGPSYRVDYRELLNFIDDIAEDGAEDISVVAYLISSPNHDQYSFINTLKMLNMTVKKRNLHYDAAKKYVKNTSWDVGITADAFYHADSYDCFVLVSGDGDFTYMTDPLMEYGKEVVVCSFENALSRRLANSVDRVYYLEEDVVYDPRVRHEERQRRGEDA
tara:strand:- start:683 stop:1228 length:546 start_codon:yes stop_codon:yes gene_type:complete